MLFDDSYGARHVPHTRLPGCLSHVCCFARACESADHEVWHEGKTDRVVLLLDTWHPDLTDKEIAAIKGMFEEAKAKGWLS